MKLYEMTYEMRNLYDALSDTDMEGTEKEQIINDNLEAIGADEKINSYSIVIGNLDADTKMIDAEIELHKKEIERLTARKNSINNNIERMKSAIGEFLNATGQEKVKTNLFTVGWRNTPDRVEFRDGYNIPEEYCKVTVTPDKTLIKNALKEGKEIDGAYLTHDKKVSIR